MVKRSLLLIFLVVAGFGIARAYESQDTLKKHVKMPVGEVSKEKEIIINPEALKAINLGAPRMSSNSSSSLMSPTDVRELTNKILGKKEEPLDSKEGRIMLGFSCFSSFYQNPHPGQKLKVDPMGFATAVAVKKGGMMLSKEAITPRYLASDKIATLFGPSLHPMGTFSMENILESIFWIKPKDHWTHYADLPTNLSVQTEMPDSLVRIRRATLAMMDSLIKKSQKKYKIVYLFCDDVDYSKANFPDVVKYVASNKEKFELFPVSTKKNEDVSCIAKYLKKVSYFDPVYVINGRNKESLILMLDQNNEAISLLACDNSLSKKFEDLKLLP